MILNPFETKKYAACFLQSIQHFFILIIVISSPVLLQLQHAVTGFWQLHIGAKRSCGAVNYVCVMVALISTQPLWPMDLSTFNVTQS